MTMPSDSAGGSEAMKPCPFCGGPGIYDFEGRYQFIRCDGCGATGTWIDGEPNASRDTAMREWNRRALAPAAPGPEWTEVTDDPATWPPDSRALDVLCERYDEERGTVKDAAWARVWAARKNLIRWMPWPAAAVAAARGTREGEGP